MKFAALLASLLLRGVTSAQQVQSKPFNLVIQSADVSLNGQQLAACHTGAAIESLCVAGRSGARFFLNTTEGWESPIKGYGSPGVLAWNLPLGNGQGFVSEPMSFYSDPSTNVALPLFEPGYTSQPVSFDDNKSQLAILSYLDDTQTPPTGNTGKALKNWYVCQTYYSAYQYRTLAWVLGNGGARPQNPSCVKVEVQRKFV
ncbi:hypothetical protein HRG_011516 [Hirsutella rhossiliensis]|uniref:DUF7907 domain-containing protein n=1 Tax=Hirsutella rhossiliensis TaxID=111463 RepID=A0A9P8MLT4_9HYPO|nr:uncharacterized protein HRG_11516 [Hirsutella rhossiliensis]KAH0957369.1 hypothetical protein HRG_11516 [Hirsutella rhossiliensis]